MNIIEQRPQKLIASTQSYVGYAKKNHAKPLYNAIGKTLSLQGDEGLHARFYGVSPKGSDLENILFYNIGSGCFSKLIQNGVVFEEMPQQDYDVIRKQYNIPNNCCVYEYTLKPSCPFNGAIVGRNICGNLLGKTVTDCWLEIKKGGWQANVEDLQEFYLDIEIEISKGKVTVDKIKHLLDGVIASMHTYNFDLQAVNALMNTLGCSAQDLTKDRLLTGREYVFIKSNGGIKWNPADDRSSLKGCRIVLRKGSNEKTEIKVIKP